MILCNRKRENVGSRNGSNEILAPSIHNDLGISFIIRLISHEVSRCLSVATVINAPFAHTKHMNQPRDERQSPQPSWDTCSSHTCSWTNKGWQGNSVFCLAYTWLLRQPLEKRIGLWLRCNNPNLTLGWWWDQFPWAVWLGDNRAIVNFMCQPG